MIEIINTEENQQEYVYAMVSLRHVTVGYMKETIESWARRGWRFNATCDQRFIGGPSTGEILLIFEKPVVKLTKDEYDEYYGHIPTSELGIEHPE